MESSSNVSDRGMEEGMVDTGFGSNAGLKQEFDDIEFAVDLGTFEAGDGTVSDVSLLTPIVFLGDGVGVVFFLEAADDVIKVGEADENVTAVVLLSLVISSLEGVTLGRVMLSPFILQC